MRQPHTTTKQHKPNTNTQYFKQRKKKEKNGTNEEQHQITKKTRGSNNDR